MESTYLQTLTCTHMGRYFVK